MTHSIAVLLLMSSASALDEAPAVRITQIDGGVAIRRNGASGWEPAKEGDPLDRGDRVAAGNRSAALILWSNGSMARLYPDAEVELVGVTFDLEKKIEKTVLELHRGRLFVKAQVPDHLFVDFRIRSGGQELRTQGAECALAHDPDKKSVTAWTLAGRLVADAGAERIRIDDGQQCSMSAGAKPARGDVTPMEDRIKQALYKVSKDLGGSLLLEDAVATPGGKLSARIGGVMHRRGSAPLRVSLRALVTGGSGRVRSVHWDFGDGDSASSRNAEHTFTQGLYVVILRVEDENGEQASAQVGISVEADCGC